MNKLYLTILFLFISIISYSQVIYSESFESGMGIWAQSTTDLFDWTRNSGPTPTASTGPAVASDGSYYLYTEADDHNNPPQSAEIEAAFDFSGVEFPIFSFDYHQWGVGIGFIFLYVFDGHDWSEVWNSLENNGNYWKTERICLKNLAGNSNVKIRFKVETQYSDLSDIAIDNIVIKNFKISNVSHTDVTCGGYADGQISIDLFGGFAPYKYSIDDGNSYQSASTSTYTFNAVSGGDYHVRVRDEAGCEIRGNYVNIQEPPVPYISSSKKDVFYCAYSKNGEIHVNVADGGTYTYSIAGTAGPFQSSPDFIGLDTGVYNVAVKNSIGCITSDKKLKIMAPYTLNIFDVQKEDIESCNGNCEGVYRVIAGGGYGILSYSIDEGGSFINNNVFSDLCAGTYRVIIKDQKGCLDTTEYKTITEPGELKIDAVTVTNVLGCNGDKTGEISVVASGGVGSISFSIDGGYSFKNSGLFQNLTAGIYHLLVRDSKNCTVDYGEIIISQPAVLLIDSVRVTDVSGCTGDANGKINIYAQGGTNPLSFSIDNGVTTQSNNLFTNLDVGSYKPYVIDSKGCSRSFASVSIEQPSPIKISNVMYDNVTDCSGGHTGRIQIFAAYGTKPYEYSIDNAVTFQSNNVFENLEAADYQVVVRDVNGCSVAGDVITITEPTKIKILEQKATDVSCKGAKDGSIYVKAEGGTGNIRYSIDGGVSFGYTNESLIYVKAGVYNIKVRDDNNCTENGTALVVNEPDSLIIDSIGVVDVDGCFGDLTGSLTIYASGGTAPYNYSINNGLNSQTSNVFSNLPASIDYLPFVTDKNGCFKEYEQQIIVQPSKVIVVTQKQTNIDTCHGLPVGTIKISAQGGTGELSYSIDNGVTYENNGGYFSGLYAGKYNTKVKDTKNCMADGWEIEIYQPDSLILDSIKHTDVICHNQGNGSINIYASGGQPQLYYSVNNGVTFSPSNQFLSLSADNYKIVVKDRYNCRLKDEVTLLNPEKFKIDSVSHTNVESCSGDSTASITVYASGGVSPILYSCTNMNQGTSDFQADSIFKKISAGTYYTTVQDANKCKLSSSSFIVTEPDVVNLSVYNAVDITCFGLTNGEIHLQAVGGNGVYNYSIDNGLTWQKNNGDFLNLAGGNYRVRVKDTNECKADISPVLTVLEPSQLKVTDIYTYNPTCYDFEDGRIDVYAAGGVPNYSYIIKDEHTQPNSTFKNLAPGKYWFTIIDKNNCVAHSDTVELFRPKNYAEFTSTDLSGCSPLEVQFNASNQGAIYAWHFGSDSVSHIKNPIYTYKNKTGKDTIFDLMVVATHALCSDTSKTQITVYSQPEMNFSVDEAVNYYPDTSVIVTNNSPDYKKYLWDFGDGYTTTDVNPGEHKYTGCGDFLISATTENNKGCSDTAKLNVFITSVNPEASFTMDNVEGCAPLKVNLVNVSANAQKYEWYYGENKLIGTDNNLSYNFEDAGFYTITLKAFGYCNKVSEMQKPFEVFPAPIVDFSVTPDTVAIDQIVWFNNKSTGAAYYLWDFGNGENSAEFSPRKSFKSGGIFDVKLKAFSANGCIDSLILNDVLYVTNSLFIMFPTAFSPNGDNNNDLFTPVFNLVEYCVVEVYSRSGQILFRTKDFDTVFWDGTKNGSPLPQGVYLWRAVGRYRNGDYFEKAGSVTLIK